MSVGSRYFSTGTANRDGSLAVEEAKRSSSFVRRQNAIKRHSLPMGDGYVQLIGKFETNAAQPQQLDLPNGHIHSAVTPPAMRNDSVPDMMDDGSPVVAELRTNVIIKDEFTLLTDLSQHLAKQYGKPSTSIMISLQHSSCLTLGGASDPCYLLNVTSVPSSSLPVDNRRVAQKVAWFLTDILGVAAGRGIILFHALPPQNVAFQSVQELKRMADATTRDARRRSGDASWLSFAPEAHEDVDDDDKPLRDTLAALQGVRADPNKVRIERDDRRRTIHEPPRLPAIQSSPRIQEKASVPVPKDRRKTLNVAPNLPTIPSAPKADNFSWSRVQDRRRSLQVPPALPTIPSPSMMPTDFGLPVPGPEDERPSTSRGRDANDNKPRLDDRSQTKAFAYSNGKPARPKSMIADSAPYERQHRDSRNRTNVGQISLQRPQSSGGERYRPVDWRVSQLLSPPTLHPPPRPASTRSNSVMSDSSEKKPRPLSLPSVGFLTSLKSNRSPTSPQEPQALPTQPRYANHNFDGVVIPPIPKSVPVPQRPHDQMKKRRSFVTALPQVESIPEVPPIPKMPEPVAVENVATGDDAPLKKRKSLFKMSFRRQGTKV